MGYVTAWLLAALTAAGYRPPPGRRIVDVGGSRATAPAPSVLPDLISEQAKPGR